MVYFIFFTNTQLNIELRELKNQVGVDIKNTGSGDQQKPREREGVHVNKRERNYKME